MLDPHHFKMKNDMSDFSVATSIHGDTFIEGWGVFGAGSLRGSQLMATVVTFANQRGGEVGGLVWVG